MFYKIISFMVATKLRTWYFQYIFILDILRKRLSKLCGPYMVHGGTLLEKQSKFPRYNMKCRGNYDTT